MICFYPQAFADPQLSSVRGVACAFGGDIPIGTVEAMASDDINIFFITSLPASFPLEKLLAAVYDTSITATPNEQPPIARGTDPASFLAIEALPDEVQVLENLDQLREVINSQQKARDTENLRIGEEAGDKPQSVSEAEVHETDDSTQADSESEIIL